LFCTESRLCSGKASSREEAEASCSLPKESKTSKKLAQQAPPPKIDPCASVIGMEDWVQQPGEGGVCRPCLLAPVTQWYMDVLNTAGQNGLAAELEGAVDGGETALAAKLDEVKGRVPPEVRARLQEFDCHAQLYRGEEDGG
jgi:hypothetical protein